MNSAVLIAAVVLAIVILWLAFQIAQSQRKSSTLESQVSELRRDLLSVAQTQSQSAEVQEQSRGLSLATQSLENILGGAKTRGLLGEVTLQRLLEDSLPPSQFATQYRFSSGEAADAVIFLRD